MLQDRRELDGGAPSLTWLASRLSGDTATRNLVLRDGARSHSDPRRLRAAILEAWTLLLIHERRGAISSEKMLAIEEEITAAFRCEHRPWSDPNSSPA